MIDDTTLFYFLSTSAQCAAAFAALVGVFAIFRLQVNIENIRTSYLQARYWMKLNSYHNRENVDEYLDDKIKSLINDIELGKDQSRTKLKPTKELRDIVKFEGLRKEIPLSLAAPMKLWGIAFVSSLAFLSVSHALIGWLGFIVMAVELILVVIAICKTRKFIQKCLTSETS